MTESDAKRGSPGTEPIAAFTYDGYERFLDDLLASGYEFRGFDESLEAQTVILRHDVDWSPERAVEMAQIEAERDVQSTYFVLVSSPFYNVRTGRMRAALQRIESLGHRVGVHFSTHQYWAEDPGPGAVTQTVSDERAVLDTVVEDVAETVSFHVPPDWVLGVDYEGFTNAYAPRYFEEMAYTADSDQRWRDEPPFDGDPPDAVQILVHPGLWAETDQRFEDRLAAEREARFDVIRTHLESIYVPDDS